MILLKNSISEISFERRSKVENLIGGIRDISY